MRLTSGRRVPFTEDGRLTIDNNVSERRVRDQAIGRKNWLFLGSDQAGPRAAVICTLIAGAKRHRIEPSAYLDDVILQLTVDASPDALERLMPDRWAAARPEHVLIRRLDESREKARRRDRTGRAAALEVEHARRRSHSPGSCLPAARARGHLVISDAYFIFAVGRIIGAESAFIRTIVRVSPAARTSGTGCVRVVSLLCPWGHGKLVASLFPVS